MPDISKIKLPGSGNVYDIKDSVAREMISGGVSFIIAWNGGAPTVTSIPAGVVVVYDGTSYTGTLAADDAVTGAFYLVKSSTNIGTLDIYDEYVPVGETGSKTWEKIGDTQVDLTDLVTDVSLSKVTDTVLGEDTTFTANNPTITVTPSTSYVKGSVTNVAVGADGTTSAVTGYSNQSTDTFVKSVTVTKGEKLDTTSIPNVTGNTSVSIPNVTGNTTVTANKSTWTFTMDSSDTEMLVIGGGNGSDVSATNTTLGTNLTATNTTLGTAITAATGTTSSSGSGDSVVSDVTVGTTGTAITNLGTPTTSSVLTGVKVTTQPTVSLSTDSTSGTGKVQVATGISSATATGSSITVGTNDRVTVLKDTTDVNVTKGNS